MKNFLRLIFSIVLFVFSVLYNVGFAQQVPGGFFYQTCIRNSVGVPSVLSPVSIRFSLNQNAPTGPLVWQEDHTLVTDLYGMVKMVIGTGVSTGAGSMASFDQIDWSAGVYYSRTSIDISGAGSFVDFGSTQLFSVPYALYSLQTNSYDSLKLFQLQDVSLGPISFGNMLKWNGTSWVQGIDNDSDSVMFAYTSDHSVHSDTSLYTYSTTVPDSVQYAYATQTTGSSLNTALSVNVNNAAFSDTALYAFNSPPSSWQLVGNYASASSYWLGTVDGSSLVFRTNNTAWLQMSGSGKFFLGNSTGNSTFNMFGVDGFLNTGVFDATHVAINGPGTKFFFSPAKAAIRFGAITGNQWNDTLTGVYSLSAGYNNKSRSYSISSGYGCTAVDYSVAIGRKSEANASRPYPYGNTIALGDSCISNAQRSVAIGSNNINDSTLTSSISSSVCFGDHNHTSASVTLCIGSYCRSNSGANWTTAIGFHATNSYYGSFVYADASSSSSVSTTGPNQFLVRASGGIVFYTDSLNTMGVSIAAGSGSWSVISDKNKKANFEPVNYLAVLEQIDQLKILGWNYKSEQNTIRHIGPVAQQFFHEFRLGESKFSINSVDMDGVILAGIKALSNQLKTYDNLDEISSLKHRMEELKFSSDFDSRLKTIEQLLDTKK